MARTPIKNPISKERKAFFKYWNSLSDKLKNAIAANLDKGMKPGAAVESAFKKNDVAASLKIAVMDGVISAVEKSVEIKNPLSYRQWYLNQYFDPDKVTLSERITSSDMMDTVKEMIQTNFKNGESLKSLAKELSEHTTGDTLPADLRELETLARKVIDKDESAYADFKKSLDKCKIEFERIEKPNYASESLNAAYARVVRNAEGLSEEGLNKAIQNAIDKKAFYNAYRIAQTEQSRAYNIGVMQKMKEDEDVEGVQWDFSDADTVCEECLEIGEADNGYGEGIYLLDDVPEIPVHPLCQCLLTPVYNLNQISRKGIS